jgi:hypothetical protein
VPPLIIAQVEMQKISLEFAILTSFLVIIFLIQPIARESIVGANPYSFIKPHLFIDSPDLYQSKIYQTTSIPIEVTVFPGPNINLVSIICNLDGGPNIKLGIIRYETSAGYFGRGTLENLTNGYHTLRAYSYDAEGNMITYEGSILTDSKTFLVNTSFVYPTILLSPNNSTYYSKEIPLTYTIDNSKYVVYYELDNSRQITLADNTTLSGLSEGNHTITAGAYNVSTGRYSKQTANFTIDTTNPSPVPSPTIPEFSAPLAITFLFVATMALAAMVKRKHKNELKRQI